MLQSFFRAEERALILKNLEDWQGLAGCGTQRDDDGDLYSAKDDLIDNIVQELFETFPERDITQHPGSSIAMSQSDRDKLHTVWPLDYEANSRAIPEVI